MPTLFYSTEQPQENKRPRIVIGEGEDWKPSFFQEFIEPSWKASRGRYISLSKRVGKQIFVTVVVFGTGYFGFQAVSHLWVEHICLKPGPADPQVAHWQWDAEFDDWTGGTDGTDPSLGWKARVLLRRAWMSTNWTNQQAVVTQGDNGVIAVHADLVRAEEALREVLSLARQQISDSTSTAEPNLAAILLRHASVLERLADKQSLKRARREYTDVVEMYAATRPLDAAAASLKLGDICSRLKDYDAAHRSWSYALDLASTLPQSPRGQRIAASARAFSAYQYAATSRLTEARKTQEAALDWIRSILPSGNVSTSSLSPSESLHHLTLLQRASMISSNLAEVIYAQSASGKSWGKRKAVEAAAQELQAAAANSERITQAITGLPDGKVGSISKDYTTSPYLLRPAAKLLWDARRSASSAYSLLGTLTDVAEPGNAKKACQYYSEALQWASDGNGNPGIHTLSSEWETLNWLHKQAKSRRAEERRQAAGKA